MDLTKVYHDQSGLSGNILQIVKREPEWAANRIQVGERALAMLTKEQRRAAESAEPVAHVDNTGSPKLPDSLLDGWDSVWSVLNNYASGDCMKRFSGTDPNAVLGDIYHKLAIIYQRQQEYVRKLQATRRSASV